jgi:hypothetical protein
MLRRFAAAILIVAGLASTASAGHHYYYHYPAYSCSHAHVYSAPVYVAPVHVAPVVVHRPAYVVLSPVYYQGNRTFKRLETLVKCL